MSQLFTPIYLNQLKLENRIVLPAMVTRLAGEDGRVNDKITERYLRYAQGEVGLMVLEAMAVHNSKSGPLLRLSDDTYLDGHRELVRKVHNASPSKAIPQIIHFLKISRSGWRQKIEDLNLQEIKTIILNYSQAACRAQEAGYDGVELHMAHAYTLSSFLSRKNRRRDEYGGSLEQRLRLPSEVFKSVRASVGKNFCIGIRFNGEECIKGGYTMVEAGEIALRFAQLGADYISISAGGKFEDAISRQNQPLYPYTGYSGDRCMPGRHYPDAPNRTTSAFIKSYLVEKGFHTPLLCAGKITTPKLAEDILKEPAADLIGLARPLLADPDWPKKVREGKWHKVIRCCYANVCKALDENFQEVRCFLWPKGTLQAPYSLDTTPPQWKEAASKPKAYWKAGKILLEWNHAEDNEKVYGYDIFRRQLSDQRVSLEENQSLDSPSPLELERLGAVPYPLKNFVDNEVSSCFDYEYFIQAYDLAGNRSSFCQVLCTKA